MKLYDAPANSWIRIRDPLPTTPMCAKRLQSEQVLYFYRIDGMYSYCKDESGDAVHLVAWAEVEVLPDQKSPPN